MRLARLRLLARAVLQPRIAERELEDEIRFHIEKQTELYVRQGHSRHEAFRRARIDFGGVESAKEEHRDGRGTRSLGDTIGDVRYALRTLWRDRGLAVAGILTLALGVGATTAVFSAVNAVMLRELPFKESARLVSVWEENPDRGWYKNVVAPANYIDWREQASGFAGMAAYTDYPTTVTLTGYGEPTLLQATNVSGNFLDVLGVRPRLGRGFEDADDFDGEQRPVMISSRLWRSILRSDPNVIGKSLALGGRKPWQVVGVLPDGFDFPLPGTDVWLPMLWGKDYRGSISFRRAHWMRVVARLKPGVDGASANATLQTVVKRLETQYPKTNTRMGAGITPLREWIVGDTRTPLLVLLTAAAVLLLIACANVGNLLLVHALSRSRDVALRFALGATRARVARQALTESLVLSGAGGLAGFGLGWLGSRALLQMQPTGMLPVSEIGIDYRVLGFAVIVTTLSGLLFGLAPTLATTRQAPAEALNAGGRTFTGSGARRWGRVLVMAEVALAVMLTIGAGLLMRSYEQLSRVPPGFDPNGVLTVAINLPGARYDTSTKIIGFYRTLIERAEALPGVERAAAARELPATQTSWSANFAVAGRPPSEQSADIIYREIIGDYHRVMRVPVVAGRTFTEADAGEGVGVALINDVLAKQYFPNEDPIGQRIAPDRVPDSTTIWRTVVGVVTSEHQASLAQPARPEVFLPMPQNFTRRMTLVVRARDGIPPTSLAAPMRATVRSLDSLLAITSIRPMTEVYRDAMSRQRFTSVLILVFALAGTALALVGVFGVLAQLVQSRRRELGIRIALGAQRSQVRMFVVRYGMRLVAVGVAAGAVISIWSTKMIATLLFGVAATDWVTYVAVALTIGTTGVLAAVVPAWRASSANPAQTLQAE
ncbi:MAG TPA: ABC transporter permease [Gemmatimonadaceae bacterium]|nr:ABC transporter permease [Gemmatimonadaceae bacterium]